jgi:pyruvate/2-oxoglutarate dehydrogenase complex dihydrolipoamide dehydrogenase (E3) component
MSLAQHYDAIVIGSGAQSGAPLAFTLAQAGRHTAVVEAKTLGGTCLNVGCTPTKTMVASARMAYLARRAAEYGIRSGPITVDLTRVRERKHEVINGLKADRGKLMMEAKGLDLIMGEASFTGPKTVEVRLNPGETRALDADLICIDSGARPSRPMVPGLDSVPALDSTFIMELGELSEHLLVLGGGYVGLEFGQMFRRFGSRVTIVHRGKALLAREDPDVADEVAKILREDGVEILLEAEAQRVAATGGRIELTVRVGEEHAPRTLSGSHVLVATGRTPNTESLNLPAAGVKTDERGFIVVNDRLETSAQGIYAIGDVKGGPAFTHIARDDYRILETNLLRGGQASTTDRLVPYTVYIDPGPSGIEQVGSAAPGPVHPGRQAADE